jgi:hypothetical protein
LEVESQPHNTTQHNTTMSKLTDYSKFDHLLEEDSDDENDEKNDKKAITSAAAVAPGPLDSSTSGGGGGGGSSTTIRRDTTTGRYRFEYNGNTIYEFEQGLDDITIYVVPPPFITKGRQINCIISPNHLKLGLVVNNNNNNNGNNDAKQQQQQQQQQSWFLNEDTYGTVDVDESTWTLEDDDNDEDNKTKNKNNDDNGSRKKVIVITLIKANRGTAWEAALKGNPNATAATATTTSSSSNTMDAFSMEQVKKDLLLEKFQEENPGFDFRGADFNGSVPDARNFMGGVQYQ